MGRTLLLLALARAGAAPGPAARASAAAVAVRAAAAAAAFEILIETVDLKEEQEEFFDVTAQFLSNPGFEEDQTYGTESKVTLNGIFRFDIGVLHAQK